MRLLVIIGLLAVLPGCRRTGEVVHEAAKVGGKAAGDWEMRLYNERKARSDARHQGLDPAGGAKRTEPIWDPSVKELPPGMTRQK
jgi:hypothetical protein